MPDLNLIADYFHRAVELARAHISSLITGAIAVLTALWAWWRARAIWKQRRFLHRVNFSLNFIEGGTLKFRTLRECDIHEVLLNNKHAVRLVTKAAQRTTLAEPLLDLPRPEAWVVLNSVLNELSEQFAVGFLAASLGLPTKRERYVVGLTCEKDRDVRINKIRVMLITESLLKDIGQLDELSFEQDHHRIRLKTLKQMAAAYGDEQHRHNLLTVELMWPSA